MGKIKSSFVSLKNEYQSYSFEEKLLFLASLAIFLPFFLSVIYLLSAVIIVLKRKNTRGTLFSVSNKWWFIAFSAIALISPIVHMNLWGIGGGIFLLFLMVFSLFSRAFMTEKLWERITENICSLSVLSYIIGVIDYVIRYSSNSEHRTASTFYNANYYAFVVEIVVVLCAYKIYKRPEKWYRYLSIFLINCSAILFCKTRTALIAIFVGLIAYFLFSKKWVPFSIGMGLVALAGIGVLLAPETFLPRYETFAWSLDDRFKIWSKSIAILGERPIFGGGLWAYRQFYPNDLIGHVNAHSIWLDTFLTTGIVGTVCIFTYFIKTTVKGVKRLKTPLGAVLLALILTVLSHCTIDLAITGTETSLLAMLLYSIVGKGEKEIKN